ncbi:hypothetical protein [Thaumasiovibrio sp. DFM-14]|uniref:hypothetical protein n=1 Tax=Thaumasiovibrio sp. DFM-14 TaxID=3384792 RepID=UPI0039A2DD18
MQELSKGLVLFSALLSPLAMADWQLNVDLDLQAPQGQYTSTASVVLTQGEETVFMENNEGESPLVGSAELLEIDAERVTVSLTVKQQQPDGAWATIATPVISAGIDMPASIAFSDPDRQQILNLAISISA